ncbi:MAG: tRNA (adenosine(37)-N6)-threonylcarbamoyltransferase complex ATPase subunit type 1 TsaE [Phycisphaerales bacterium]
MPTVVREVADEEMTGAFASGLADVLRPGDVVLLEGEMGAGKTTLVRSVGVRLGVVPALISSPTFVILNAYPIAAGSGALAGGRLIHADAYRVAGGAEELENAGWDRLIDAEGRAIGKAAAFIEWPARIAGAVPTGAAATLTIEIIGEQSRRLTLIAPDHWAQRGEFTLLAEREPTRCRKTGVPVSPTNPAYPFADARARDADLFGWFTGSYKTTRSAEPQDPSEPT